ncbi:MAG: RHS repeat-associated core domain-containing protein [Planctomycetes bacterium]|nr:RHS repeat-associated core domain-containing protein [Planctomycetota bacterium]
MTEDGTLFRPLHAMKRTGEWRYYHADRLGSIRLLTATTQQRTDSYSYEAFGQIVRLTGGTVNPYRYVGTLGCYDDTLFGLLHMAARHYAPSFGIFLQRDPLEDLRGSLYSYSLNNPVAFVDPTGMQACPDCYKRYLVCVGLCYVGYAGYIGMCHLELAACRAACGLVCAILRHPRLIAACVYLCNRNICRPWFVRCEQAALLWLGECLWNCLRQLRECEHER